MHNSNIGEVDDRRSRLMIARIAEALHCPVASFSEFKPNKMTDTAALLTSWHSLRDARDREKVLAYIRTIAGKPSLS